MGRKRQFNVPGEMDSFCPVSSMFKGVDNTIKGRWTELIICSFAIITSRTQPPITACPSIKLLTGHLQCQYLAQMYMKLYLITYEFIVDSITDITDILNKNKFPAVGFLNVIDSYHGCAS